MPNGLDAMRQQRENRRGKPAPMHPRKPSGQAEEPATEIVPPASGVEQPGTSEQQQNGSGSQHRQTRQRRSTPRKTPPAAHDPAAGAVEGKQVADLALAWSAAARKLGQRGERLRSAVEAAHAAGTPAHVIQAALSNAEYGAEGVELPDEVWRAAGINRP